jgi:N-acetylglucosamine-6-phosphate deacetylase
MAGIWNEKHPAREFGDAVVMATRLCSTTPADLMGLAGYGRITEGGRADLCVLDISGTQGNYKVTVEQTMVDGKVVYKRQ